MTELNIVITAIGAIVLLLGLVSDYFRRNWWTSDPLAALVLGNRSSNLIRRVTLKDMVETHEPKKR